MLQFQFSHKYPCSALKTTCEQNVSPQTLTQICQYAKYLVLTFSKTTKLVPISVKSQFSEVMCLKMLRFQFLHRYSWSTSKSRTKFIHKRISDLKYAKYSNFQQKPPNLTISTIWLCVSKCFNFNFLRIFLFSVENYVWQCSLHTSKSFQRRYLALTLRKRWKLVKISVKSQFSEVTFS